MNRCFKSTIAVTIITCGMGLTACNKSDDVAPVSPVESQKSHEPSGNDLLNAPRERLKIRFAPFSLELPSGWKLNSLAEGRVVLLEGPAPGGTVSISISSRRKFTPEQVTYFETGARQLSATAPTTNPASDSVILKMIDQVHVIERKSVEGGQTALPAGSSVSASQSPMVRWVLSTYIPSKDGFDSYDFSFVGLMQTQYETDKAFLQSIFDSLKYEEPQPETIR